MTTTLIRNGVVIDTDPHPVVLGPMDVRIDDGVITEVGPDLPAEPGTEVIDATGRLVLPGFVDTHRHTWQAGLRAIAPDIDFATYRSRVLGELAPRLTPHDMYAATLAGALECLDAGVTTLLDWNHAQFTPGHTDAAVDALRDAGIRAVFGFCHGGVRALDDASGMAAAAHRLNGRTGGLVTTAMAALGPEIAGEERVLAEWRLAAELGLPVTAHLGGHGREGAAKGLDFLEAHRLLATPTTFVHALHYTDAEFERIAAAGGSASVSPVDEMSLGLGYPTTGRSRAAGVPTGLSADTVVFGPGDMFTLMRTAYLLERGRPGGAGFTTRDALRMATAEGARVVGLGEVTGSLRPGRQADVLILRTDTLGMAAAHDPIAAVVLNADTSCVDTVLVAGRAVKRAGQLLHHEVATVVAALADSARAVVAA